MTWALSISTHLIEGAPAGFGQGPTKRDLLRLGVSAPLAALVLLTWYTCITGSRENCHNVRKIVGKVVIQIPVEEKWKMIQTIVH